MKKAKRREVVYTSLLVFVESSDTIFIGEKEEIKGGHKTTKQKTNKNVKDKKKKKSFSERIVSLVRVSFQEAGDSQQPTRAAI